jgi:hypothetical protein
MSGPFHEVGKNELGLCKNCKKPIPDDSSAFCDNNQKCYNEFRWKQTEQELDELQKGWSREAKLDNRLNRIIFLMRCWCEETKYVHSPLRAVPVSDIEEMIYRIESARRLWKAAGGP